MPIKPYFLTTDILVFVLLGAVVAFGIYAARHEHLRAPWRQVLRRPMAMASAVVLLFYVGIGLLDSLHYQVRLPNSSEGQAKYSPQIKSVLDALTKTLKDHQERTYSAPFATHAFTKETVEHPDGHKTREAPRLKHGGRHLEKVEDRGADIAWRVVKATLVTFALGMLLTTLYIALVTLSARRKNASFGEKWSAVLSNLCRGRTDIPWRAILVTVLALIWFGAFVVFVAPYYHILGTDQVGQDVFLKSLKSIRTGLLIGTLTTLVMLPFAVILGMMAGYFRGVVDDVIQYLYTTLSSIPGVLLIAASVLSLQIYMAAHPQQFESVVARSDTRLLFLCLILGVMSWTGLCRLLRGETLKLREADYVASAHALGSRDSVILARHVLPNVMHIVLITVVLDFSDLVLAEAVLSYVGVGVDPTMDSWGNMINGARLEMAREPMVWWSLASAFAFMFTHVLAANLFADAVRDAFDPRLRK